MSSNSHQQFLFCSLVSFHWLQTHWRKVPGYYNCPMTSLNMLFLCPGDCLLITPNLQNLSTSNASVFPPLCPVHKTGIALLPILVLPGVTWNPKHVCLLCESHTFLLNQLLRQLSDSLKLKTRKCRKQGWRTDTLSCPLFCLAKTAPYF